MKVCKTCNAEHQDDVEKCHCGNTEFKAKVVEQAFLDECSG